MWLNHFDKIYLVNLPARRDRYWISTWELSKYSIPFETVRAIAHPDGREGLYQTMRILFEQAVDKQYKRILVFEDDLKIVGPMDQVMGKCVAQLPEDFDLFYLGCNLARRPSHFYSENLLPVTRALSTHAVAYSLEAMKRILSLPKFLPVDLLYADVIQQAGRCYCACPMLVTQYPGFSDIEKRQTDWTHALDERFLAHTRDLLDNCRKQNELCCMP